LQKLKQFSELDFLYSLTVVQSIAHVLQAAMRDIYKFAYFKFYARIWVPVMHLITWKFHIRLRSRARNFLKSCLPAWMFSWFEVQWHGYPWFG